jgi:hypothetical protein
VITCTVDELRAAARIGGYWLPAAILDDDDEDLRVDLAALRGLAVRGLVDGVVLAPDLATVLDPLRDPRTAVEVETEDGWHAIAGGDALTVLTGRSGGLVAVSRTGEAIQTVLVGLCDVDVCGAVEVGFSVGLDALDAADDLVLGGESAAAVEILRAAGAPSSAAVAWVRAVETRRYSAHVRAAYRDGDRYVADEVRWLVGGDGTAWTTAADGAIRAVGPAALRTALVALLEGRQPCPVS